MPRPDPNRLPTAREVRLAYNARHAGSMLRDRDRFYQLMARRVLSFLDPGRLRSARLLDVGCGGGYFLREAHGRASSPFQALCGLEISDVALRAAKKEAPAAHLVLGQGEALPFCDRSFDAVVCLGNLEHFLDPVQGTRELERVCRLDGRIWVLLPNSYYSGDLWRVIRTGYGPNHHQILERFATVNEWRDLLEAGGLHVEEVLPYNRFKWWKRLLPRNLAYHFLYRARPRGA